MDYEFKELTVEELARGYVIDEDTKEYTCIFCGEKYEEGLVYTSNGRLVTAEKAMSEHIINAHDGSFNCLVSMDKQMNGLSDTQKNLLMCMYEEMGNKEIGEEMNINPATVRTHKFNLQKMKREAKVLLALLEQIEDEDLVNERRKQKRDNSVRIENVIDDIPDITTGFSGNTLHLFFTLNN